MIPHSRFPPFALMYNILLIDFHDSELDISSTDIKYQQLILACAILPPLYPKNYVRFHFSDKSLKNKTHKFND